MMATLPDIPDLYTVSPELEKQLYGFRRTFRRDRTDPNKLETYAYETRGVPVLREIDESDDPMLTAYGDFLYFGGGSKFPDYGKATKAASVSPALKVIRPYKSPAQSYAERMTEQRHIQKQEWARRRELEVKLRELDEMPWLDSEEREYRDRLRSALENKDYRSYLDYDAAEEAGRQAKASVVDSPTKPPVIKFSDEEKPAMATKDAGTFTIPQQRAMREAEARDARIEAARAAAMAGGGLPQNQYEMMAQLYRANTPASPAHAVMGNTINSYLNYGRNLDSIYNSPTGPYGQMQAAATAQRPYKAEERVAKINTEAAKDIARQKLQGVRQMARLFERRRDPLALAELDGDFGAAGPVARPSFYVR